MTIAFSSRISQVTTRKINGDRVELHYEGHTVMTKGLFDYFATPYWFTDWFIYAPDGTLIDKTQHWHAISSVSGRDEAWNEHTQEVPVHPYYRVQLRGRHGDVVGEPDKKTATLGVTPVIPREPIVAPGPVMPEEEEPVPVIPYPSEEEFIPEPEPGPEEIPLEPQPADTGWVWLLVGGLALLALVGREKG